jgi:hypothetical protein
MGYFDDVPQILDLWNHQAQNLALVASGVALIPIVLIARATRWKHAPRYRRWYHRH